MAKKKQHGGAREGAGRKLKSPGEGRSVVFTVSVPEGLVAQLMALAEAKGMSRSEAATQALREFVAAAEKKTKRGK